MSVNLPDETNSRALQKFRLLAAKARYPHLPSVRTTTRERGNGFQGWAIYTDGGTRLADGETLAGWSAVARSLHGRRVSCLAQLLRPKLIWHSQVPDSTPTTPLTCRPWLS